VSQQVSYDVYLKTGVDRLGRDESGDAVAHFIERGNAVSLKRRLEARGETVHVEKSIVYGLSEPGKESWFSDYSRIPEFGLPLDPTPPEQPAPSQSREEGAQGLPQAPSGSPPPCPGAQDGSEGRREPWYKRWFG